MRYAERADLVRHCLLVGLATFLLLFLSGCSSNRDEAAGAVVATVNGEPVHKTDLDKELLRINKSFSIQGPRTQDPRFAEEVLRQMIRRRLLVQHAGEAGITLTREQIRKAVSEQRGGTDNDEFAKMLERAGISYTEWEQRIAEDRIIELLIRKRIDPRIRIDEPALAAYYEKHPEEFQVPERVKVRQIVLPNADQATKVRERLVAGNEDFGLVAREVSLSPDGAQGGEIGVFPKGKMPPEFDTACFSLQIGEISPVIQSPYGYHIFRVDERFPAGTLSFKDARKAIYEKLFSDQRDRIFAEYQRDLWNRAKISLFLKKG